MAQQDRMRYEEEKNKQNFRIDHTQLGNANISNKTTKEEDNSDDNNNDNQDNETLFGFGE
jgi:hypothetical protein